MLNKTIAKILVELGAVGVTLEQPVTFKSGIQSPIYMDNRILPYYPAQWQQVIQGFEQLITEKSIQVDVLGGIAAAGIPHSSALAYQTQTPSIFIRKEAKGHGKQRRIEGGSVDGLRVVLVEDLITTGGSSLSGVDALRAAGAIVEDCLGIVTYGFSEAEQNFKDANVRLHTLTDFPAIVEVLRPTLSDEVIQKIEAWRTDPYGWTP